MEKVKLPKEVADAIAFFREETCSTSNELIIRNAFKQWEPEKLPNYFAISEYAKQNFDFLISALVNGYEVEQTPEEMVKDLYLSRKGLGYTERAIGIYEALNVLGIKIPGVNAE